MLDQYYDTIRTKLKIRGTTGKAVFSILTATGVSYAKAATDPYLLGYQWNKSIVSIYIDDTPYSSNIPSYYYSSWRFDIVQAIDRWGIYLNDVYNASLYLITADTKSSADIVIQYGVSTSWAQTNNTRTGTTLIKSKITLDDCDLYNNGFDTYTVTN